MLFISSAFIITVLAVILIPSAIYEHKQLNDENSDYNAFYPVEYK